MHETPTPRFFWNKTNWGNFGKTPIKIDVLTSMLQNYPNKIDNQILAEGFLGGFNVGYEGPRIPTNCRNLASTYILENQLEQKLLKELKLELH
jgi:hypothetical protein